jgi:redox-sensitive bicupin YhaK (pirin superfamily)
MSRTATTTAIGEVRRAGTIHHERGGWFDARWHFSFGGYVDREHVGIGPLRVFNDDRIVAGAEWPMHPHADIESLTWVVSGHFSHADSLGNGGELEAGAAQVMRFSSRGAHHSERNGSQDEELRFLQFWILPSTEGLATDVQQRQWRTTDRTDRWLRIMSGRPLDLGPREDGVAGPLELAQDATVDVARATPGTRLEHVFRPGRGGYVYVVEGEVVLDDADDGTSDTDPTLRTGDALAVGERSAAPRRLTMTAHAATELVLVDVPLEWEPVGIWRGRV